MEHSELAARENVEARDQRQIEGGRKLADEAIEALYALMPVAGRRVEPNPHVTSRGRGQGERDACDLRQVAGEEVVAHTARGVAAHVRGRGCLRRQRRGTRLRGQDEQESAEGEPEKSLSDRYTSHRLLSALRVRADGVPRLSPRSARAKNPFPGWGTRWPASAEGARPTLPWSVGSRLRAGSPAGDPGRAFGG
jgi:hypothetical protein